MKLGRIHGGWSNVPKNLKCKTDLKEMGLKAIGKVKAEVWNRYMWVDLYDISETVPRKKPTDKQLAAIEKANEARLSLRTCYRCGVLQPYKDDLKSGICKECDFREWLYKQQEQARQKFLEWWKNKEQYVILDTETTGLGNEDEIIEIAVVDLDGHVLLDTLVKPTVPIQEEAHEIHGLLETEIVDAPTFVEIATQLQQVIAGKTVLIYNDSFDNRMVYQSAKKYGLEIPFESNCVMETYAKYYGSFKDKDGSFRWIKLADASTFEGVNKCQTHRAVGDCQLVRELIKSIAG